jgi:nucleoside 2-deoxyribosyltransferase
MAYAKGARCYGYTRDKRAMATKNQYAYLKNGKVFDEHKKIMPYASLPFSPTIIASTKIIEGDFDDCLKMLIIDLEEEYKIKNDDKNINEEKEVTRENAIKDPVIYLSNYLRYDEDAEAIYQKLKEIAEKYHLKIITPIDNIKNTNELLTVEPYRGAVKLFDNYQQHVRKCDILVADLNNYNGFEINNDVAFECGMAFQLGKKLYGFMENTNPLINKIPNLGEKKEFRDHTGSNVENFNYPANLMFSSSMNIIEGDFETVIKQIAEDIKKGEL